MNVIENEIEAAIDKELQAATERFGLHHSNHEKYAVIIEELQECKDSLKNLEYSISDAWDWVKCDNERGVEECIDRAYKEAVNVAIEACQVAAMCKKEIEKPKEIAEPAELSDHGLYTGHDPVRVFRCTNCGNDFVSGIHPHPIFCPRCGGKFSNVLLF